MPFSTIQDYINHIQTEVAQLEVSYQGKTGETSKHVQHQRPIVPLLYRYPRWLDWS